MLRPKVTGNVQSELVGRPGEKLDSCGWQELTNPLIAVEGKVGQIGFHAEKKH